jgi:hypothetical protein
MPQAVDRAARGEDEALNGRAAKGAEHALKTQHIYLERFGRMRSAIWNEMQRRQVKNGVGPKFLDASQIVVASDVSFDHSQRPVRARSRSLKVCVLPQPEVVDDQDDSAGFNQSLDEVRANKTTPTGHQNTLHLDGTP